MFVLALLHMLLFLIPNYLATDISWQLPPSLPRCYVDDPQINDCLLNATIALKPYVRKGIQELGVPSYDPRVLSNFEVVHESKMANYTGSARNFTIRGMDNYDITAIQYDPKTMTLTGKIEFDPLSISSDYLVTGKLLSIPLIGNGTIHLALGPIHGEFKFYGQMMKRRSIDYYDPLDINVKLTIDDLSLHADGLYDGNVEYATRTNELLNRNSKVLADVVMAPLFEELSEKLVMKYMKWLTQRYPYYELFPRSNVN